MMNKVRNRIGSAARLLLLGALLAAPAIGTLAQSARVEYVDGDVRILRGSGEEFADFGTRLFPDDRIVTGSDGVAVVTLNDRAQVKLRENTSLVVSSLDGQGEVELQRGGIFARVVRTAATAVENARTFQVRTPTVVAGVRGTQFFVAYGRTVEDLPDVWLCVNEGVVEVEVTDRPETTLVEAGEGINILNGNRPTEPQFYPWTLDLNWNFDPADGEVRDVTDLDAAYGDLLDQDYD